jgi:hypothetical protein
MFSMRSYWNAIKGRIAELQGLGTEISNYQQKLGVAYTRLVAKGRQDLADLLNDELAKVQDDLNKWWTVKGYIDSYLPEWAKLDEGAVTSPTSGVGVVPFILAGMALVALAYVVNTGMALLQDYAFKRSLTADVIAQKITSGQAKDILSVPRDEGILEKVVSNVGIGVGVGIPTVLLVGGGLYLLFATGMLKGILGGVSGMFSGGSSSSTPSSGG